MRERPDLDRLRRLRSDRAKLHRRIADLQRDARSVAPHRMDGMPRGRRSDPHGALEKFAVKIADLEADQYRLDLEIVAEEIRLQRFISSVSDPRLRLIIRHRCIDGLTWPKVAQAIGPRVETPDGVKAAYLRFVRQLDRNPT